MTASRSTITVTNYTEQDINQACLDLITTADITVLEIGQSLTNQQHKALMQSLQNNNSVTHITYYRYTQDSAMSCEQMSELIEVLKINKTIEEVGFIDIEIDESATQMFILHMIFFQFISLHLDSPSFKNTATYLCLAIQANAITNRLSLGSNVFSENDCLKIIDAISDNRSIIELAIHADTELILIQLTDMLAKNTKLKHLELTTTCFSSEAAYALKNALIYNNSLTKLSCYFLTSTNSQKIKNDLSLSAFMRKMIAVYFHNDRISVNIDTDENNPQQEKLKKQFLQININNNIANKIIYNMQHMQIKKYKPFDTIELKILEGKCETLTQLLNSKLKKIGSHYTGRQYFEIYKILSFSSFNPIYTLLPPLQKGNKKIDGNEFAHPAPMQTKKQKT